jgi:hypothetical protein
MTEPKRGGDDVEIIQSRFLRAATEKPAMLPFGTILMGGKRPSRPGGTGRLVRGRSQKLRFSR